MAFTSLDELLSKMSSGRSIRTDFAHSIVGSTVTGRSYELSAVHRSRTPNSWSGTALTWTTCNDSAGNGTQIFGIPHGGNVSTDVKHLINLGITSYGAIGYLTLIDIQGYWPGISTATNTTQTLSGTPSLRYTNGVGCKLFFVQTTAAGATAFNLETLSYTNSGGTSGRGLGRPVTMTPSAVINHITHSGPNNGNDNFTDAFIPLDAGDTGVQNVASIKFSASSGSGAGALVLAKPLISIPVPLGTAAVERDAVTHFPAMPIIKDGACLSFIYTAAIAASAFAGYMDFAWD